MGWKGLYLLLSNIVRFLQVDDYGTD